jgi:hypothetical protein
VCVRVRKLSKSCEQLGHNPTRSASAVIFSQLFAAK